MREKVLIERSSQWTSGYFKPKGRWDKKRIHKAIRRIKDLDIHRKGIYNRIGVVWDWS